MMITIMAYSANWVDTCRGCVMDRTDSTFDFISTPDQDKAIIFLADHTGHETTVLIDGKEYSYSDGSEWNEDTNSVFEALMFAIKTGAAELVEKRKKAAELVEKRKKLEEILKEEKKEHDRLAQEVRDRETYKRLKEKFEKEQ